MTGTNGQKIFVETPIPPADEVELRRHRPEQPVPVPPGQVAVVLRACAQRSARALPAQQPVRSVLVGHSARRHHRRRQKPRGLLRRTLHHHRQTTPVHGRRDVHRHGPPKHDQQRAAVQGVVAPKNLREMEALIRSRVQEVLDEPPDR
ncbi:hypothetical protein [Nocardioides convexus]|uniref:hypothetical protein n=1 Tax=Nocardioides convexus TaxID=2712224 RepID=UPI0024185F43|nr:hypothetical protein [Nocardioides convexus]